MDKNEAVRRVIAMLDRQRQGNRPPAITAIYVRQSRASSNTYSSCAAQESICRDTAAAQSWEIKEVYTDEGGSSETLERPALARLLSAIKAGEIKRLIVYGIDRLTRKLSHLQLLFELLDQCQIDLIVVTDPSHGRTAATRLSSNIIAAASEFQMEITRERMADSRADLKRRGKRVAGRVPFGYRTDPRTKGLIPDEEQSILIRDIFQLASDEARPSEIATSPQTTLFITILCFSKCRSRFFNRT